MSSSYKDYFDKAQKSSGILNSPKSGAPSMNSRTKTMQKASTKRTLKSQKMKRNPVLVSFLVMGFIVTLLGTVFLDDAEKILNHVEIGFLTNAVASETGVPKNESSKTPLAAVAKEGAPLVEQEKASPSTGISADLDSVELNHFARLRERKLELDQREEGLKKLEQELAQQKIEIEQKLKELEDVRRKISTVLDEKVQGDDQKVDNLVQFYSNMKAPQAAKIMETLDEGLAVQVIARMKKKNAADIMNLLPPAKAQSLSEKYVGYKK